jgi:hypothetical protein
MELTDSFLTLLQNFDPVFTAPTYQTLVVIVTGWILSQRHRYVTEVILYAAISEASSNRWNFSVISDSRLSAWVVESPSMTSLMAA